MKTFAVMPDRIAVKVRTGDTIETFEFKGKKRRADVKILQLISEGYTLDATHETMTPPAMDFQVRVYPNDKPETIMDRGILVSSHATWREAADKAERLNNEGRAAFACRAIETLPQPIKL